MKNTQFYFAASDSSQHHRDIYVDQLGIHEQMPPGIIRHGGCRYPYLFMFFHSQASVWLTGASFERAEQQLIIWDCGTWHHYGNTATEWDHSWMIVRGDKLGGMLEAESIPLNSVLDVRSEGICLKYFRLMYDELQRHGNADQFMIENMMRLWLHELARARIAGGAPTELPSRLLEVRQYIDNNFSKPMSLGGLAFRVQLSIPRFSALFSSHFGVSPIRYVANLRLQQAAHMMLDPNMSIKDVALAVGFADSLYFSRQFRKHFGCSPKSWRKRYC